MWILLSWVLGSLVSEMQFRIIDRVPAENSTAVIWLPIYRVNLEDVQSGNSFLCLPHSDGHWWGYVTWECMPIRSFQANWRVNSSIWKLTRHRATIAYNTPLKSKDHNNFTHHYTPRMPHTLWLINTWWMSEWMVLLESRDRRTTVDFG